MKTEVRIVLSTFPNHHCAKEIGRSLLDAQLIACINLLPNVESMYRWKGDLVTDSEVLALMKTTASNLSKLKALIISKHPYETPEFLVIEPVEGSQTYLDWIADSCQTIKKSDNW